MTEYVPLINDILRDFVVSANVANLRRELAITCTIQSRIIQINENVLNTYLQLPPDNFDEVLDEAERTNFFMGIHCTRERVGMLPSKIYIKHLPKEWNFFFNSKSYVFAPKSGGFLGIIILNEKFGFSIAEN